MSFDKPLLEKKLETIKEPFSEFVGAQTTASLILVGALLAGLILANSPYAHAFETLIHYRVGLVWGDRVLDWTLLHLVNDGLIALFFFLIGLEVKREFIAGELQDPRRQGLLLSAALGGMALPALLYLAVNLSSSEGVPDGWGIPMATDTALAMGVLAALAARVPRALVAFLVGVAVIDDIGAILVIALFYTESLAWGALAATAGLLLLLALLNLGGFRHPLVYALVGLALWGAIVQSGVHASIAGVIVALTVPARPRIRPRRWRRVVRRKVDALPSEVPPEQVLGDEAVHARISEVEQAARDATTPVRRWENALDLPVSLLILPLFAFLNAGIEITPALLQGMLGDPVAIGIALGLIAGKPAGLLLGIRLGQWLGLASRPPELTTQRLLGLGMLAGIGFTMSTFIAHLALGADTTELGRAKLAILCASLLAAVAGYLMLRTGDTAAASGQGEDA